jgi:hypothetical protein
MQAVLWFAIGVDTQERVGWTKTKRASQYGDNANPPPYTNRASSSKSN